MLFRGILQILASYGVFVVKNDQFSVDTEEVITSVTETVKTFRVLVEQWPKGVNRDKQVTSVICPLLGSLIKSMDRVVTETAGCDSFVCAMLKAVDSVVPLIPEKSPLKDPLVKKFSLVSANAWLKLADYEQASAAIEKCCKMIH